MPKRVFLCLLPLILIFLFTSAHAATETIRFLDDYETTGSSSDYVHLGDNSGLFSYTFDFALPAIPDTDYNFELNLKHFGSGPDDGYYNHVYIINDRNDNIPLFHEVKEYFESMGRVEEIGNRAFMVTKRVF